jgi:hypothetical protein
MIVFQSSAIVLRLIHLATIPPLPAGEGRGSSERGERHFLCCSFVGESFAKQSFVASSKDELYRGRQSTLIWALAKIRVNSRIRADWESARRIWRSHRPHGGQESGSERVHSRKSSVTKILNPFQTHPKLSKPFQDPGEGGGNPLSLNLSNFSQIKVNLAFSRKKKIVYFSGLSVLELMGFRANQSKSTLSWQKANQKPTEAGQKMNQSSFSLAR